MKLIRIKDVFIDLDRLESVHYAEIADNNKEIVIYMNSGHRMVFPFSEQLLNLIIKIWRTNSMGDVCEIKEFKA